MVSPCAIVGAEEANPMLYRFEYMTKALGIPHFLFLNKIDTFQTPVREIIPLLQPASSKPLVLRQIPIWENGIATGFVDLALERAFVYREHAASEVIELPSAVTDREKEARFHMLEQIADYDDALMEQLLSDIEPPRDRAIDDFEAWWAAKVAEIESTKRAENAAIEDEMNRYLETQRERIRANNAAVQKAHETFTSWKDTKRVEERRLYDHVQPFVTENPVTLNTGTLGTVAATPGTPFDPSTRH